MEDKHQIKHTKITSDCIVFRYISQQYEHRMSLMAKPEPLFYCLLQLDCSIMTASGLGMWVYAIQYNVAE